MTHLFLISSDKATARTMSLTRYWCLLRFVDNRLDAVPVIHGQHAPEGVGAKMFDEGLCDLVAVFEQQVV